MGLAEKAQKIGEFILQEQGIETGNPPPPSSPDPTQRLARAKGREKLNGRRGSTSFLLLPSPVKFRYGKKGGEEGRGGRKVLKLPLPPRSLVNIDWLIASPAPFPSPPFLSGLLR